MPKENKKRGPKPRHGKDRPCVRKSLSIPEELWQWCEERALILGKSTSAYAVGIIEKHQRLISELQRKKGIMK